jgi:hypothetical protein
VAVAVVVNALTVLVAVVEAVVLVACYMALLV